MKNMQTNSKITSLDECPFTPGMGTINASGVLKNLNGSKLSLTEIFLREAVQNSFDARLKTDENTSLIFKMRAFHFKTSQFENFKSLLNKENSKASYYSKNVEKHFSQNMLNIEVSDLNTSGLIGNYEPTEKIGNQNFTNFVYFTGNDKQKDETSGGSYGFGKAALFAYSKARMIAVYTRIHTTDYQSRFIVISSDERIKDSNSDRCWWGVKTQFSNKERGFYAAPVLGDEADRIAESIGMIPSEKEQTGTKILVLNAGPEDSKLPEDEYGNKKTIDDIFKEDLPKYIVHWYWNKILAKKNKIEFALEYGSNEIQIENPLKIFPYKIFVASYNNYVENKKKSIQPDSSKFKTIKFSKPQVTLGYFSFEKTPVLNPAYKNLIDVFKTSDPVVAYMRGIGHIVYYERIPLNNDSLETTCYGIFRTDTKSAPTGENPGAIDRYFREVENQTHDKWEHQKEKNGKYNYVKRVEEEISDIVKNTCGHFSEEQKTSDISIVIQRTLGEKLMPYLSSIGGAKSPLKAVNEAKESVKKSKVSATGEIKVTMEGGKKFVFQGFRANPKQDKKIRIKNVVPVIKTIDVFDGSFCDTSVLEFNSIEIKEKDFSRKFVKKAFELGTCIFEKTQDFFVKIECKKDCSFDVKIDWEEIDEL